MSSRRIPDPGSLIAGIAFAGIGLIFLVGDVELADRARWMWPIVLVGLGAGLLAAVLRRPADAAADGPVATTTAGSDATTFPPAEPSIQAGWAERSAAPWAEPEPGAAAGPLYEPLGESKPDTGPEGSGAGTGPAEGSLADEPGPAEGDTAALDPPGGSPAERDAEEGSSAGRDPAEDSAAKPDAAGDSPAGDASEGREQS